MFIKPTLFFQSISFLLLFTIAAFGQNSGGSDSQGKVWNARFPYPSDFPPLEDARVFLSTAPDSDGNERFTAMYFPDGPTGNFMLTYDYQEVNLSPTKIKRMEKRHELARLITDPAIFGTVNIRGFTDVIERKRPDPTSPLGFQGVLIGDYLDTKTTITHSFRADSTVPSLGV